MECKLCKTECQNLRYSHIIPECFYKGIYNEEHRFAKIDAETKDFLPIEQKGYREHLLCHNCEQKLGVWENNAKKHLLDITSDTPKRLSITRTGTSITLISDINYNYFKKCMLSILWRMSISKKVHAFRNYDLGPYEEPIRTLLNDDSPVSTCTFPLMVHRILIGGKHYSNIIFCSKKDVFLKKYTRQSFVIFGFMFDFIISRLPLPEEFEKILLQEDGRLALQETDIGHLNPGKELLDRFSDDDVKKFYKTNT